MGIEPGGLGIAADNYSEAVWANSGVRSQSLGGSWIELLYAPPPGKRGKRTLIGAAASRGCDVHLSPTSKRFPTREMSLIAGQGPESCCVGLPPPMDLLGP